MEVPKTPADSPLTLHDVMGAPGYQALMTPALAVGDPAFAIDLPLLDPETHRPSGGRLRLSDHAGERPVALVFGSYT